jgi:hypothetical protein
MNMFSRIAFGSALLLTSAVASAVPAHIPAGNYGDPQIATFDVTSSGATVELPCANISISGMIIIEAGGKFSTKGEQSSNLVIKESKPVTITGTINSSDKVVKMTVEEEDGSTLNYTFTLGEAGVGARCES